VKQPPCHGNAGPDEVLAFWRAAGSDKWFAKEARFDAEIVSRFGALWRDAAAGKLAHWEDTPEGALALVIVLDQFPRNMFRGDRRSYQSDAFARAVADRAIRRGYDQQIGCPERRFFYLPFMHSEQLADQENCLALARACGDEEFSRFAEGHADVIRRFGRFPHRNALLGRPTTPAEQAFLDAGGFAG
jgi:uncharacterized protein (DUF924 family)